MKKLSRRTVLRSAVATMLLPTLEWDALATAATQTAIPKRLVFLPMGYGVDTKNWLPDPTQVGANYDLPSLLKPFEELKPDFSIIQNLTTPHKINPHAGTTNFLTCANTLHESGAFTNEISCDQIAAQVMGDDTRHNSLAISSGMRANDGHGGPIGYASWGPDGKPVGVYRRLADLYGALFGTGEGSPEQVRARLQREQSSLDAVIDNAKRLERRVSATDRDRMDEYFTTVRSIENRLSKAQQWADRPYPDPPFPMPENVDGREEIQLTLDLMHLAIQSDSTRVMTYMLPTQSVLRHLRSGLNPHKMSHFGPGKPQVEEVQRQRDMIFSELVADFLKKLKATKERDGSSLLDHTLVAYGSRIRQNHNHQNGPMMLAGHGGGGLIQGRNLVYESNTPLSNLWLSMIRHVGVQQDQFANSEGVLSEMGFS